MPDVAQKLLDHRFEEAVLDMHRPVGHGRHRACSCGRQEPCPRRAQLLAEGPVR